MTGTGTAPCRQTDARGMLRFRAHVVVGTDAPVKSRRMVPFVAIEVGTWPTLEH